MHGTLNLTSDSCSAYVETYSHQPLGHYNVGKYFKYGNRQKAEISAEYALYWPRGRQWKFSRHAYDRNQKSFAMDTYVNV